jgi:hypothetical protein
MFFLVGVYISEAVCIYASSGRVLVLVGLVLLLCCLAGI